MPRYTGEERREEQASWHLNKSFSLGVIIAILANTGSFIWFGAKLDSQVWDTATKVEEIRSWRDKHNDAQARTDIQLAVMSERLSQNADVLAHVAEMMERNADKEDPLMTSSNRRRIINSITEHAKRMEGK